MFKERNILNKRIRKKKFKRYHKQFCHESFAYRHGLTKNKYSESSQCSECGWDALEADEDMKLGHILWSRGGFYDYEFEVEYKCPVCGNVFSYCDGA